MHERLFTSMSPEARRFYHVLFNNVTLNLYAVRTGLFDTILCQTDDPAVYRRWMQAMPNVIKLIQIRGRRDLNFGEDRKRDTGPHEPSDP